MGEDLEALRHELADVEAAIEEGATDDLLTRQACLQDAILGMQQAARAEAGVIEGTAELEGAAPADYRPEPEELVVAPAPPGQELVHATLVTLDKHDENQIITAMEERLDDVLLYSFRKDGKLLTDLSWQGVMECVRQLNATTKTRIRVIPETLTVDESIEDTGDGPEPYLTATVAAVDEVTGYLTVGTSSEPKNLHKKNGDRPFDVFARAKAINKAQRNAMGMHIPERLRQAVIALYLKDERRVLEVKHGAGAAATAQLPPPVATPKADELVKDIRAIYADIRRLSISSLLPGQFNRKLERARSSEDALEALRDELDAQRTHLQERAS